jgi:hypothetical protein
VSRQSPVASYLRLKELNCWRAQYGECSVEYRHNGDGMKRTCLAAMLLVIAFACRSGGTPADPAAGTTVLQGGTLINPGTDPVPNALIVIQEGRITCAGTGAACTYPAGAKSVDLRGAFVGPGLIDAHVHYSQTGWLDGRPDAVDLRQLYPYESVIRELEAHPEHFHRAPSAAASPAYSMSVDSAGPSTSRRRPARPRTLHWSWRPGHCSPPSRSRPT